MCTSEKTAKRCCAVSWKSFRSATVFQREEGQRFHYEMHFKAWMSKLLMLLLLLQTETNVKNSDYDGRRKGETRGRGEERQHSWIKDLHNTWITANQEGEEAGVTTEYVSFVYFKLIGLTGFVTGIQWIWLILVSKIIRGSGLNSFSGFSDQNSQLKLACHITDRAYLSPAQASRENKSSLSNDFAPDGFLVIASSFLSCLLANKRKG